MQYFQSITWNGKWFLQSLYRCYKQRILNNIGRIIEILSRNVLLKYKHRVGMMVAVDQSDCNQALQAEFKPRNSHDGRKFILAIYLLKSTHIRWLAHSHTKYRVNNK